MRIELRLRLQEHRWGPMDAQRPGDEPEGDPLHGAGIPRYLYNEPLPRYIEQWPDDSPARALIRDLRDDEEA
jgi:hypothetical protein